jgi:hypothetical protein
MKRFFIISVFIFTIQAVASELTWVDEQIKAIKPPRVGVSKSEISTLKDPFFYLKKPVVKGKDITAVNTSPQKSKRTSIIRYKTHKKFTLAAIMNDSALINSKWYKINEKINGYKISKIGKKEVLLVKNGKKILLSTKSNNKNLKFKSE